MSEPTIDEMLYETSVDSSMAIMRAMNEIQFLERMKPIMTAVALNFMSGTGDHDEYSRREQQAISEAICSILEEYSKPKEVPWPEVLCPECGTGFSRERWKRRFE